MRLSVWGVVLLALALGVSSARADAPPTRLDRSMVVLDFAPQTAADKARADAVTALITARLAQHPGSKLISSADVRSMLGVERQKQLLGCTESNCVAEIGGALGARYIVSGQVGRLGSKILLRASLVDAEKARAAATLTQQCDSDDELAAVSTSLADQLADAAGLEPLEKPIDADRGFALDLKLGNTVPILTGEQRVSLKTLSLRMDLELAYFVTPQTSPFLGASVALARGTTGDSLQFIPVLLGAKHYFRPARELQPYLGGGVGLGFLAGKLAGGGSSTSFALTGVGGLAYFPWRHVGFNLEASANLSGVNVSNAGLLIAYNADFGVLFLF